MRKVLVLGAIAVLAAWIYSSGKQEFQKGVAGTAASKTDIFN